MGKGLSLWDVLQELLKLRKKITSTVQVLTHLKEKLQFVQAENHVQNSRLKEVEAVAAQVSQPFGLLFRSRCRTNENPAELFYAFFSRHRTHSGIFPKPILKTFSPHQSVIRYLFSGLNCERQGELFREALNMHINQ